MATISIIAAIGRNGEIGARNTLPWRLPDDLKRFKQLTTGHAIIMGRKTYESIGRSLPNRKNIIITKNQGYHATGCVVVGSMEAALQEAGNNQEIFIIGGGEIYKLGLPYANRLYLTFVDAELADADIFFPKFDEGQWKLINTEKHEKDEGHIYSFVWKVYEKKNEEGIISA
jgi:dihydrofolate reductase